MWSTVITRLGIPSEHDRHDERNIEQLPPAVPRPQESQATPDRPVGQFDDLELEHRRHRQSPETGRVDRTLGALGLLDVLDGRRRSIDGELKACEESGSRAHAGRLT